MMAFLTSVPQAEKSIINEKYLALVKRLEAYENELRTKKNKMAEIINAIWRGGNATLIDEIDRIMGVEEWYFLLSLFICLLYVFNWLIHLDLKICV